MSTRLGDGRSYGSIGTAYAISLSCFAIVLIASSLYSNMTWLGVVLTSLFTFFASLGSFAIGYESAKDDYRVSGTGRLYDRD